MHGHDGPLILLLGDSLIDYGEWHRRLPGFRTVSSGVPGERAEELLHRLPRLTPGDKPDAVVLMTGTNNIVFGDFSFIESTRRIIAELKKRFPDTPILVTGLLPFEIPGISDTIHTANDRLQRACSECGGIYFDLCRHFETSTDRLFDFDGVHLSNSGYRLWAAALDEYLRKLLAKEAD